ncbi:hypothetical protein HCB25_07340 [Listeria booriae]|uniref:Uncharacterized protein n=1 Tax=Listeria booriae TaxID=1552123 RepID=A0A842EXF3_9LIST|nr:hypothetical protein [Listeria booriae]MBC2243880.1 hypothetical protein [Listeria booriae]
MARIASFICCKKTSFDENGNTVIQSPISVVRVRKYPLEFKLSIVLTICDFAPNIDNTMQLRISDDDIEMFDTEIIQVPNSKEDVAMAENGYQPILTIVLDVNLEVESSGEYEVDINFNDEAIGAYPLLFVDGGDEDV